MTFSRNELRQQFIASSNWAGATVSTLPQDASNRQYYRLNLQAESAILMDAQPPEKPVSFFAALSDCLRDFGLHSPQIYQLDAGNGFLLLQDFGTTTFTRALNKGVDALPLYLAATDALVTLHTQPIDSLAIELPVYNQTVLLNEIQLLCDWYIPYKTKQQCQPEAKIRLRRIWAQLFSSNYFKKTHQVTVLRDYHVDNLMLIDDIQTPQKIQCGQLDFQDALIGHPAYDLMSLLEDARRDVPQTIQTACLNRYHQGMKNTQRFCFEYSYSLLAVQRHAKVLGIFVRLAQRDNKQHYLQHIARTESLLMRHSNAPHLHPLFAWFNEFVPELVQ